MYTSPLPHISYMPRPSHSFVCDHLKNIFTYISIYLCLFSFSVATSTLKELNSGTNCSAVCISVCLTSLTTCKFCSQEKWFLNPEKILWESVTKYPSFFKILFWAWQPFLKSLIPLYKSQILFILLLGATSSILDFRYSFLLFLLRLPASCLTWFQSGSCHHCILASFLWSKNT